MVAADPLVALDAMGGDNAPGAIVEGAGRGGEEVMEMHEPPAQAARQKRQSSIAVGLRMLKQGEADAFVSAGNTGAVMAAAIMYVGRVRGIERPSLVGLLPFAGKLTAFLDVGANADAKPEYLLQWAQMAAVYMEHVWKVERPSVGM